MALHGDYDRGEKKGGRENESEAVSMNAGEVSEVKRTSIIGKEGGIVNASGHQDQLQRQYGLWSICGLALTIDTAWVAFGGAN